MPPETLRMSFHWEPSDRSLPYSASAGQCASYGGVRLAGSRGAAEGHLGDACDIWCIERARGYLWGELCEEVSEYDGPPSFSPYLLFQCETIAASRTVAVVTQEETPVGVEPTNSCFADSRLTVWHRRLMQKGTLDMQKSSLGLGIVR